jgi:hypothetical protein
MRVLLLLNARNQAFTAAARCQRDWRHLPIAHAALSSPKIDLGLRGEKDSLPGMGRWTAETDHP